MEYLQALGQVLREFRVSAELSREACAGVLNRDHLAKVEQGRQALTMGKFVALCELLGVRPSQIFFAVESRLSTQSLVEYQETWRSDLDKLMAGGRLHNDAQPSAARGVRGKRAEDTCSAVRLLQAQGLPKMQVVRRLGIGRTTVDRYWLKG